MSEAIEAVLPHRAPFLFLDEVVELSLDRIVARRTVRADEPHFAGHYPNNPIMPGVLLCEAALQAGCYLLCHRLAGERPAGVPVVTRMNEVKFKRIVRPGETLEIQVEHERTVLGASFMKAILRVSGRVVASLGFAVMLSEAES